MHKRVVRTGAGSGATDRAKMVMHLLVTVVATTLLVPLGIAGSAQAKVPGANGRITFGRWDPAVGDQVVYTVNPDGSGLHQVIPGSPIVGECPHWSPDGSAIATCGNPEGGATRIIDPETGTFRDLAMPDPTLFTGCDLWSPDGRRLACEGFGHHGLTGIYTLRVSDGSGLQRVTSNPEGDDLPGDYSPTGDRIVFGRTDPARPANANRAVFVVDTKGTGLHRITPWGLGACCGSWSPDGRWILFGGHGKLYVVHPDGTALAQIPLSPATSWYVALDPGWSPDGTMMVFTLLRSQTDATGIYIANADGTRLTQVTHALPEAIANHEGDELPDWGARPPT